MSVSERRAAGSGLALSSERVVESPWLFSKKWDLLFLIGSVLLVPLPLLMKNSLGLSAPLVSLGISTLLGGPHLFATFTYTLMERRFWLKHPYYAVGVFVIPPMVVLLGLKSFPILVATFFFLASVHVLHQCCYLGDCYQTHQDGEEPSGWRRAIDYAVIVTSLYPVVCYRLVRGTFYVAGQTITIPHVFGNPIVCVIMISLFIVSVLLYAAKSFWEWRRGELSLPKTLLIGVSVPVLFLLPLIQNLDAAFQGLNVWHSLQYLAIAWWINWLRKKRCQISSPFVQSISGRGKTPLFYLSLIVPTLCLLGLVGVAGRLTGLSFNQCYFIAVFSGLLIHFYLDHWVFTKIEAVVQI